MESKKGITLIALIITIIVLLILTGVTLSAIMGDNGIVTQAMRSSERTKDANLENELQLAWTACMSRYYEDLSQGKTTESLMYTYFMMDNLNNSLGSLGQVRGLKYNPASQEYRILYTSNSDGLSYEIIITQNGGIQILDKSIDLASGEYELTEEVISNKIYAIYYPDTKVLAFSNDGSQAPEEDRGTTEPIIWNNEESSFIASIEGLNKWEGYKSLPWGDYQKKIKKVNFVNTIYPTDTSYWFCSSLVENIENLSNLKTSNCTNMKYMFYSIWGLKNIDMSVWDTSKVTDMSYMFYLSSLETVNLSNLDFSAGPNISHMFDNCHYIESLDFSTVDTSKVTDMSYLFYACNSMTSLNIGGKFNTSSVTNMAGMFQSCDAMTSFDLSNIDTSNVTNMKSMFTGCESMTSIDLSKFDTSNVTDMSWMFHTCESLDELDLTNFETSNVTTLMATFYNMKNGVKIYVSEKFVINADTDISSIIHGFDNEGNSYSNKLILVKNDGTEVELTPAELKELCAS